jgi:V8-like Glu-specific endopeptidase
MKKDRHAFLWFAGAAATLILTCGNQAQAQSADGGSAQAPILPNGAQAKTANPLPPDGPFLTNMPLATRDQFTKAEQLAAKAVPTGTAGVSSGRSSPPAAVMPFAYGTSTAPYTTARVAVTVLGNSSTAANTPVTSYPYRATGKLYFKIGTQNFICTASLIKKGVLITAAHCVFNFGQRNNGWYNSFVWCPANTSSSGGVYGCYNAGPQRILSPYFEGTDVCAQRGVVCNNDIATLLVAPKNGVYAGNVVGWYNYSWNGYSYKASSFLGNVTTVEVTQLGYPLAFDSGYQMERTDAVGWYFTSGNLKNTQIGSAQTGGSSGGPWLANFGTVPSVDTSLASRGSATVQTIVGVTSYGSTTIGYNRQGASFFGQNSQYPNADYGGYGAGNIGLLVRDTCTANRSYC